MRGGDPEHVADELGGREAAPRMRRERRRTRAAVHVVRIVDRAQPLGVIRRDLARVGIDFFPDADLRRSARDVHRAVRPALPFRQRVERRVPRLRAERAGPAHRNAEEFADVGIAGVVFVLHRRPLAGEIHLRESGPADGHDRQQTKESDK